MRMGVRRVITALAAASILASTASVTRLARADDADEADLHFNVAADAYERRDFKVALEHFLASNRLVPNKNVLFNIARTYEQLHLSSDAYRYYVQAAEGETDPAAKKRVEEALQRIAPQVAVVRVTTNPPGATIYVDRKDLGARGTTPRTLALPPGKHTVLVELEGHEEPAPAEIDLKVGAELPATFTLQPVVGTFRVEGEPAGAEIRVDREDGPPAGILPGNVVLKPGRHTLFISKPGFQPGVTVVEAERDKVGSARVTLTAQSGTLVASADVSQAQVYVDGEVRGFTPTAFPVSAGPHRIRIEQSGYQPVVRDVFVAPNQQTKVDVELAVLEQVTAASRADESIDDAPASVSVITSQELRAMGYPTLAEALRGVRGLYLSDDRSYGSVDVRGFTSVGSYGNRILVMIDGHPTNDNYIWSSYVGFDGRLDLEDVERIEVVRGPGSVLYGTGAFSGVINLVTRGRNAPTRTELGTSASDYGTFRARVSQRWRANEHAGVWMSATLGQSAGGDFYFRELHADPRDPNAELDAYGRPVDGLARGVSGFQAATVSGRAWYKALTAQWFVTSMNKHLPTAVYESVFNDPRTHFADTRGFLEARFEPRISETVQLLSRAHANFYNFDGLVGYGPPDGASRDTYRGKWAGVEQRVVYEPTSKVKLTFGAQAIRHFQTKQIGTSELTNASYIYDDFGNPVPSRNDPLTEFAGYALGDVRPHRAVKVSAGARFDYYSNLDSPKFTDLFNPRLAVIWKPYARGNLKVMGGKAFRTPSVYELYFRSITQVPSVNLRPEQIYSGEVEFSHRFSSTVTASVAGYVNHVSNLIQLNEVTVPREGEQYQNSAADVRVVGGEAEVRREWKAGWMVGATYSYARSYFVDAPELRELPNSAPHLASVKAATPIIGRTLMAMSRVSYSSPRPDRNFRDTDPPQGETEPGVVWDLVLSGEVERAGLRYALGAYNVADWKYDTVPSAEYRQRTIVQNGRTFLATVSLSF